MASINPHIHFNGNTEEAFEFYRSVFGGDFSNLVRYSRLIEQGYEFPEHEHNKIMHIALPIGTGSVLMGSDVPEILGTVNEMEHRSKISITAETKEEADALFTGLSKDGSIEMPIADSPWGSYFGAFRDKYGVEWMISFTANN